MKDSTFSYVRSYRQRHALATEELALLVNQRSSSAISLIETGDRAPTLEAALALQVIFGADIPSLFPGLFERVEDGVMRRARALYEDLEGSTDPRSHAKRALLEAMAARHEDSVIEA